MKKILPVFYGFDIPMVSCRNLLKFYRADYLYCRDRSLKTQKMNMGVRKYGRIIRLTTCLKEVLKINMVIVVYF